MKTRAAVAFAPKQPLEIVEVDLDDRVGGGRHARLDVLAGEGGCLQLDGRHEGRPLLVASPGAKRGEAGIHLLRFLRRPSQ